jgi:proline racemase
VTPLAGTSEIANDEPRQSEQKNTKRPAFGLLSCPIGSLDDGRPSPETGVLRVSVPGVIERVMTIDAHVGGQPLRLVIDGLPHASGRTMADKGVWLRKRADRVRRALIFEPRGHADMIGAVLTEAVSPKAHAGILFMDGRGYPAMSGHGIIGAAAIAVARGLIVVGDADDHDVRLAFDTPAGVVHTVTRSETHASVRRIHSVVFTNVPAFVHSAAQRVRIGTRELRVDVAFGGLFYAIVDTEAVGIPLRPDRLNDLRRLGVELQGALNAAVDVAHPLDPETRGISGVVFTGPPTDPEAHLRSVIVTGAVVDRSPGGIATAAVMAVLDAMGLLAEDRHFVHESVTGALFRGRAVRRTTVGESSALVAEIEGNAWITGEHTFLLDEDDPFRDGVLLEP